MNAEEIVAYVRRAYAGEPEPEPRTTWRHWAREALLAVGGLVALVLLGFIARLMLEALKLGWSMVP